MTVFAAMRESAYGTKLPSGHVRLMAAIEGKADVQPDSAERSEIDLSSSCVPLFGGDVHALEPFRIYCLLHHTRLLCFV